MRRSSCIWERPFPTPDHVGGEAGEAEQAPTKVQLRQGAGTDKGAGVRGGRIEQHIHCTL